MIQFHDRSGRRVIVDLDWFDDRDQAVILQMADAGQAATLRAAFAAMDAETARLLARATPGQLAITYGSHWRTIWQPPGPGAAVPIWGQVLDLDELRRDCRGDMPEWLYLLAHIEYGYRQGWRYSRCYSRIVPDGELGGHHAATLTPISDAEFNRARISHWR